MHRILRRTCRGIAASNQTGILAIRMLALSAASTRSFAAAPTGGACGGKYHTGELSQAISLIVPVDDVSGICDE